MVNSWIAHVKRYASENNQRYWVLGTKIAVRSVLRQYCRNITAILVPSTPYGNIAVRACRNITASLYIGALQPKLILPACSILKKYPSKTIHDNGLTKKKKKIARHSKA